jgi:hypothetical protein
MVTLFIALGAAFGAFAASFWDADLGAGWSWILVRRGMIDEAFRALTAALKNSDNETLKRNHECLMNNRTAHFNNSGLGDQWYSLLLEEPKVRMQRQRPVYC